MARRRGVRAEPAEQHARDDDLEGRQRADAGEREAVAETVEQARDRGPESIACLLDAAFERISPDIESAHAELAAWLQIGHAAGLPLAEYDDEMERLKAEVGYWMAEARDELGVLRTPTFVFEDGTTIYVQLDREVSEPADAHRVMDVIRARLGSLARDGN